MSGGAGAASNCSGTQRWVSPPTPLPQPPHLHGASSRAAGPYCGGEQGGAALWAAHAPQSREVCGSRWWVVGAIRGTGPGARVRCDCPLAPPRRLFGGRRGMQRSRHAMPRSFRGGTAAIAIRQPHSVINRGGEAPSARLPTVRRSSCLQARPAVLQGIWNGPSAHRPADRAPRPPVSGAACRRRHSRQRDTRATAPSPPPPWRSTPATTRASWRCAATAARGWSCSKRARRRCRRACRAAPSTMPAPTLPGLRCGLRIVTIC